MRIERWRIEAAISKHKHKGFCLNCGQDVRDIAPDARKLKCPHCSKCCVCGTAIILMENLWD